jgi:hypothetical protein
MGESTSFCDWVTALPDHFARIDQLLSEHPDAKVFRVHEKGNNNGTADNAHLLAFLSEDDVRQLMRVASGIPTCLASCVAPTPSDTKASTSSAFARAVGARPWSLPSERLSYPWHRSVRGTGRHCPLRRWADAASGREPSRTGAGRCIRCGKLAVAG